MHRVDAGDNVHNPPSQSREGSLLKKDARGHVSNLSTGKRCVSIANSTTVGWIPNTAEGKSGAVEDTPRVVQPEWLIRSAPYYKTDALRSLGCMSNLLLAVDCCHPNTARVRIIPDNSRLRVVLFPLSLCPSKRILTTCFRCCALCDSLSILSMRSLRRRASSSACSLFWRCSGVSFGGGWSAAARGSERDRRRPVEDAN